MRPPKLRSGNQSDVADLRLGRLLEVLRERLRPAPVGQRLLRRLGRELRDRALARWHGRGKLHARLAQPPRPRPPGVSTFRCTPGAELEARELRQARHHVDPPAEALGVARRRAHPHVERRERAQRPSAGAAAPRGARRRPAARPRGTAPPAAAARSGGGTGTREANGQRATASASIATIRSPPLDLLLEQVGEQVAALRAVRVGGEALALARDRRRHERKRVELRVRVRQRRAGLAALVHDHVDVRRPAGAPACARATTNIAVSTSSASRSASDHTGFGEFTISSCAPRAGRDGEQLRLAAPPGQRVGPGSGSPRARAPGRGWAPRARASPGSRARSPPAARRPRAASGPRGPPRRGRSPGRSAAAPARRARRPGRVPRSPATITRSPDSGSMRSSGKALLHGHVLDPLLLERLAGPLVAVAQRRAPARRSGRAARCARRPAPRATRVASARIAAGHAPPAGVRLDREPAEPGHVRRGTRAGRCRARAPSLHGHDVRGLGVAAVAVGLPRDALLAAEHALAQVERRGQLLRRCGRSGRPEGQRA